MKPNKISRYTPAAPAGLSPTRQEIDALARAIWIDRGRNLDNWLEAERQLRGEVSTTTAADAIPAAADLLDPDRALKGGIERELDRIVGRPEQRSPTSL